jgi:hypothetical protein
MANVKTTRIEKKYKDKKTGEYKSLTIEHAKVKDRLKAFWESNPQGSILTDRVKDNETIEFVTNIIADQSNEFSRKARGHAMANLPLGDKDYEKLETISVGRALALIGFATDGEVASFEEIEDFNHYKEEKLEKSRIEIIAQINDCKSLEELKKLFFSLDTMMSDEKIVTAKDIKKLELEKGKK